jgi:anti-sigma regulatory factor (Ser/Thr protein kinase)
MVVSSQIRMTFAVPIDRSQSAIVRQRVRQLLAVVGFDDDVAEDVVLALGEAFANVVAHGTGACSEHVGVSVSAHRRHVSVQLRYPGEPFDTRPPAEPLPEQFTGRGRYLMTALMDTVTYAFLPGETIVRLEKTIKGALGTRRHYTVSATCFPQGNARAAPRFRTVHPSRRRGLRRACARHSSANIVRTTGRPSPLSRVRGRCWKVRAVRCQW